MRTSNSNITKLMLTEFYELSKTDIDIQIIKNEDSLRDTDDTPILDFSDKNNEIESMIKKFYMSLSSYFSKNTGSDFTYDNINYSSYNSFKKNYLKFLKYNGQTVNKITS